MTQHLQTIRDFIRYAETQFEAAGLNYGHGVVSAHEDAFYLVFDSLNLPMHSDPSFYFDAKLTKFEQALLLDRIETRVKTRKPTAYITGNAYLQGLKFKVNEQVLVPRSFIAEILGNYADPILPETPDDVETVLDLCTGSGCLAILAAHIYSNATIDAVDISKQAIEVANQNVTLHNLKDRVNVLQGDLFAPIQGKKYDLIITNPPYVTKTSMANLPPEYRHEPSLALEAGDDGMDIVKRIMQQAKQHLSQNGLLICELGDGKAAFETLYPDLEVVWFETEHSIGEVFAIRAAQL